MKQNTSQKHIGLIALCITTLLWSNGFLATQYVIDAQIPVEAMLSIRFLIGSALLCIGFLFQKPKFNKTLIKHGLIAGAVLFTAFFTQTLGQLSTPISTVAFITSGYVVFVPFFIWLTKNKKPSALVIFVTLFTMVGMFILNYTEGGFSFPIGSILVLLCAIGFAIHVGYIAVFCKEDDALSLSIMQLGTAGVLSLLFLLFSKNYPTMEQMRTGSYGIIYLTLFSTTVCYFLQTLGQKYIGAETAGIIMANESVFATLLSVFLHYEVFSMQMVYGGGLIVACGIIMCIKGE
ncbi:MAG: DMT family transporter [Eubacteriales bacterium]|nr:DMT family transporter [Eubacteriales bacterium]